MNGMLNIAFSGEFRFSRFKKAYISYTTLLPSQPPRLGILSPHNLKYCLFLNPPWYKLKTIVITTVLSSTDSILASLPRLPRLPPLSFNFSRISEMVQFNFPIISEKLPSWPVNTFALIFSYSLLCRFLRFRRMKQKHAQYPYKTPESFANMTADDAYEIAKYTFSLEFPFTTEKAAQFALFRLVVVSKPPQPPFLVLITRKTPGRTVFHPLASFFVRPNNCLNQRQHPRYVVIPYKSFSSESLSLETNH